jgi:hypothetical protein
MLRFDARALIARQIGAGAVDASAAAVLAALADAD